MSASFPTSVKSFTTKSTADVIQPAHVNDAQDEIAAIETYILAAPTSYVPTITNGTLGNGTITGQYTRIGQLVFFTVNFLLGTTSAVAANIQFSLPVTASDQAMMPTLVQGYAFDTSGSAFYPVMAAASGSATIVFPVTSASPMAGLSSLVPFTWATADALRISGWYYAA